MLTVEHFTAEALRQERLKAHAAYRSHEGSLRWFLEMLGFSALKRS